MVGQERTHLSPDRGRDIINGTVAFDLSPGFGVGFGLAKETAPYQVMEGQFFVFKAVRRIANRQRKLKQPAVDPTQTHQWINVNEEG